MSDEKTQGELDQRLLAAARNAVGTCLSVSGDDRVVLIHDQSCQSIATALRQAFDEVGASSESFDMDSFGERPFSQLPGVVAKALERATVSALALTTMQGELTSRVAVLETVTRCKVRHAHMPSITPEVFADGLAMDYREISRFTERLVDAICDTNTLLMTSHAGTNLEFTYKTPPELEKLDGLITRDRWQNLPSGQIIVTPVDVNGTYVVDGSLGDWFEHKYDVREYPVTLEFEEGRVRGLTCDNRKLERALGLYLRSSDNSGRVSELVLGANLGLTQDHKGALYEGYRPGASISVGGSLPAGTNITWTAATFLPMTARGISVFAGDRQLMTDSTYSEDLTADIKV